MLKKIISIGIILFIIALGFFQKNELFHLIKSGGTLAILISILLVAICVFFPVIPFPVLAGAIGAVFGGFPGLAISLTGSMVGTMCFFLLSRYGFRDFAQEKLKKYEKAQEFERFLESHSFLSVLMSRLIPVIPAPVVNIVGGLSQVKWVIFFFASMIGKIPNVLILSFAGAAFTTNKLFSFGLYGIYLLVIFLIALVISYRRTTKKPLN